MTAAYLDGQLEKLLQLNLVEDRRTLDELFNAGGALGTFYSRINLAFALGLLDEVTKRDLHLIRQVRNDFSHVYKPITFEDPAIRSRCFELQNHAFPSNEPRALFVRAALGTAAVIHGAIINAKRPQSPPSVLTGKDARSAIQKGGTRFEEIIRKLDNATLQRIHESPEEILRFISQIVGTPSNKP